MKKKKINKGILTAIQAAGSQLKLAELIGVQQPMISRYLYGTVPAERAIKIEKTTGVRRSLIRPDLYRS